MVLKLYLGSMPSCYTAAMTIHCHGRLHPKAVEGLLLFNKRMYFEAHEEMEQAWREEHGEIRNLYKGILQVAVTYLHIMRENYEGAIKVHARCSQRLKDWPDVCRGIRVRKMRGDLETVMQEVHRLGREHLMEFDPLHFKNIEWTGEKEWICDRCGHAMIGRNCKITCPNCGNRFDCSDLNIYLD